MKMWNIFKIIIIVFLPTVLLFHPFSARAQFFRIELFSEQMTPTPQVTKKELRCVKNQAKNAKTIRKADIKISRRKKLIETQKKNIDKQIDELERVGCDVRKLRSDQRTLEKLLNNFYQHWQVNYKKYISLLEKSQKYSCTEELSAYVGALQETIDQHNVLTNVAGKDQTEIDKFIKRTFQEDIKSVYCSN